jgi:hypothetical protein
VSAPLAVGCNCPDGHQAPPDYRGRPLEQDDWHCPAGIGSAESAAEYAIRRDRERQATR